MASLPTNLPLPQLVTKWKSQLDPVLANPMNDMSILSNVSLSAGSNTINHLLGQTLQGWVLVDIQGPATVYRPNTAAFNDQTLTLVASAAVTVSIGVF